MQHRRSLSTSAQDRSQARVMSISLSSSPEEEAAWGLLNRGADTRVRREFMSRVDVLVAGSVAKDLSCDYKPLAPVSTDFGNGDARGAHESKLAATGTLKLATSNPASIRSSIGGVGHNIALALHHLGVPIGFCSAVGNDPEGEAILRALKSERLSTYGIQKRRDGRTSQYIALNNTDKSLFTAVADMSIFDRKIDEDKFYGTWRPIFEQQQPKWVILDANWSPEALEVWTELAKIPKFAARVVFEPVSVEKSIRAFPPFMTLTHDQQIFDLTTPNEYELEAMYEKAMSLHNQRVTGSYFPEDLTSFFSKHVASCLSRNEQHDGPRRHGVKVAAVQALYLLRYFKTILVKFGSAGILQVSSLLQGDPRFRLQRAQPFLVDEEAVRRSGISHQISSMRGIYLRWHPPAVNVPADEIVSVNGVGDTFLGVLVAGLARTEQSIEELIHIAQLGAVMTLKSPESVSEMLRTLGPMTGGALDRAKAIDMLGLNTKLKESD